MKIQTMFEKDINRDINGVIKVRQDDEHSLQQELSEYIITKELRKHFRTFFDTNPCWGSHLMARKSKEIRI